MSTSETDIQKFASSAADQRVDVWYAHASSGMPAAVERCCENWLVPEERERADRFRKATTRNQHVVGRGMARRLLGGEQVAPDSIAFKFQPQGKPMVSAPAAAMQAFNVAHTDGMVICGVANDNENLLGVDVERLDRKTDLGLATRYFAAPECQFLESFGSEQKRREIFMRIWTLKESFIKAIGTGLQTPLADFAFEQIESETPTIRILNPKLESDRRWQFRVLSPSTGFVSAVAIGSLETSPARTQKINVTVQCFDTLLVG